MPVPKAMRNQLARLFGSRSKLARSSKRTSEEWRNTLKSVLAEIRRYIAANVDTDELHRWWLQSGLDAAERSLGEEDFWPGYTEGITRLALTLLGDYPNHARRKPGRKKDDHYLLSGRRSVRWLQDTEQRFKTLWEANSLGYPPLSANPRDVLDSFRRRYGYGAGHAEFMEWYRLNYPQDYAMLFR